MCWGENKNAHPEHGTDVAFASVVPPNLGCRQPHLPGTTLTGYTLAL